MGKKEKEIVTAPDF